MTFEALVDRLTALFDVTQTHAVDVANERLSDFVARSTALRAVISLGTTTSGTSTYTLAANVVKILEAKAEYANGTVIYEGNETLEDLWRVDAQRAEAPAGAAWVVVVPDSDADATTDSFRLYPTPSESGVTITGLVALRPATLTYSSGTALPIPVDLHKNLLDGAKADLYDEEGRQDESAKHESSFELGIRRLESAVNKRGKGSSGHRIRVRGYDLAR